MLNKYLFIIMLVLGMPCLLLGMDAVAVYPEYFPPYFVKDRSGDTVGLGIDVMKKLSEKTGINVKYVPVAGWSEAAEMIKNGQAQIVLNVGMSPERKDYLRYTVPMDKTTLSIITTQTSRIRSVGDLHGAVVATHPAGAGYSMMKKMNDVSIITADNPADLLYFLMSGRADAMIFSEEAVNMVLSTMRLQKNIRIISPPLSVIDRAFGVTVNNTELYRVLNDAMSDFVQSDEYKDMHSKWYKSPSELSKELIVNILLASAILLAAGMLIWRYISIKKSSELLAKTNAELKEAQTALIHSETRFKAMAETINDIIWFTDAELTKVLYVNKAYEKIYGRSLESLYANPISYMECIPEEDRVNLVLSKGGHVEPRNNIKHRVINARTGETRWVLSQYYPYKDENGEILFYTGMISDITSVVEAENEKAIQQQITAQQSKFAALGEMVGSISHQWRQPLNTLYLCMQLMEDACDTEPSDKEAIQKYIKDSMELIEHMSGTIDDFRDFFKTNKKTESFDAPRTVLHILRMITPQLKANKITYNLDCTCALRSFSCVNNFDPGNPPCKNLITGIPNEFKHAVLNLLQNAKEALVLKDSTSKNIHISMSSENEIFTICITDNAGGVDEKLLPKIFDPYISGKTEGTGMGLYMTKTIIDKMNGSIKAENVTDGAKFVITLPVMHISEETPAHGQESRPH